jgi:hypothetical protein
MAMRSSNYISANGCAITHALVLAVLAKSNLHWEMHHAMLYALECMAFVEEPTVLKTVTTKDMTRELLSRPQTQVTLMGLPVVIDNERYPKGLIRLMSGDKELSRIEALAIPDGFMDDDDYTEEGMQRERRKFEKLTY